MESLLDTTRESVIDSKNHVLVIGGPGSGKTTLALKKSIKRIGEGMLDGQTVLFLSFSRAAVARVLEAAKFSVVKTDMEKLSVQTFHSFFWSILKTYGYLLGVPKELSILLPQDEKAISDGITEKDANWTDWLEKRDKLFNEEGKVAFDLFQPNVLKLLKKSDHILNIIALCHPLIIVDEAQDTADDAWQCIKLLARNTQIVCLADLEQQIFNFLPGVKPERISDICSDLDPLYLDLGTDNYRSPDTDILKFGNDILSSHLENNSYKGVFKFSYNPNPNPSINWNQVLRTALAILYKKLHEDGKGRAQSIAILTMTKNSALKVSNALNGLGNHTGKIVKHKLVFDETEVLLLARLIAFLLEPKNDDELELDIATCIEFLAFAKKATGKGKEKVDKFFEQINKIRAGKILKIKIVEAFRRILTEIKNNKFAGNPTQDWIYIKNLLKNSGNDELRQASEQLNYLSSFNRRSRISSTLSDVWLKNGAYIDARKILDIALAQEKLLETDSPIGLQVMNIHKSKGKQFDGVVFIRESIRNNEKKLVSSFIWRNDTPPYIYSRKLVRVGITRAQRILLILNPYYPRCPLLGA